ncbi:MAG: hypothetical protein AAB403_07135, partial [Planctomycetota bacterium]
MILIKLCLLNTLWVKSWPGRVRGDAGLMGASSMGRCQIPETSRLTHRLENEPAPTRRTNTAFPLTC